MNDKFQYFLALNKAVFNLYTTIKQDTSCPQFFIISMFVPPYTQIPKLYTSYNYKFQLGLIFNRAVISLC